MKKHTIYVIFSIISVLFLLCGCSKTKNIAEEVENPQDYDLVVYSSHPEDIIRTVIAEFRERTGLNVFYVKAGTATLLDSIQKNSDPKPDVLWGGGIETLSANEKMFEPYVSVESQYIPESMKERNGLWTGFTVLPMTFVVNKKLLDSQFIPHTWDDLFIPELISYVAFADPTKSASAYTMLWTMLEAGHADKSKNTPNMDQLRINQFASAIGHNVLSESSMVLSSVFGGEYLVGLTFESSWTEIRNIGSDVEIIYPKDGTTAVPDGVAIIKKCTNRETAEKFIDFVLSKDVAKVMSFRFGRRSARIDVKSPSELPELEDINLIDYDINKVASDRDRIINNFVNCLKQNYSN